MRRLVTAAVLGTLDAALPRDIAEPLVGDLAEEAPGRSLRWLVRQSVAAVWFVHSARWRATLSGGAVIGGLAAGGGVLIVGTALWRTVLHAVPRRADHPMGLAWTCGMVGAAIVAATLGSVVVRTGTAET